MKKSRLFLFIGIFILVTAVFVIAKPFENSVYLIKSNDFELKEKFGVRHNFDSGFTTWLNPLQVKKLQSQGIEVEEVPIYYLLAPPWCDNPDNADHPACGGGDDDDGGSTDRATPSDQTPWGIEIIYNDDSITSTSGGNEIDVAVLDTGVYKDHLDLSARIEQCVDFTGGGPFNTNIKEGSCEDKNGHGTHVAGTIAADAGSDGLGIYGIAPEADIFAYKVCGNNGCYTDDIAAAIDYAGSHDAEIVSMSLGGDSESSLIRDAISRNSHVLFIAAAGNDGPNLETMDYPGASPNVIGVAAIDSTKTVASFSSRGVDATEFKYDHKYMEVAAPGVSVESTWNDGSYNTISGTSMATPHVSGLAAKLWRGNAEDTRTYLQQRASETDITSGDHAGTGYDAASGFGLPTVG